MKTSVVLAALLAAGPALADGKPDVGTVRRLVETPRVVRGETIRLRPRIWGECATESTSDVRQFDIGFDSDESKKTGIIQGVRKGSNAWEAGVRNGQRWSAIHVVWGDPGYLAELEIRDGERTRRVKYYPASSNASPAPQYIATSSHGCDSRAPSALTPR